MNCPGCREADIDPNTWVKYMDCMECDARALAAYPEFVRAGEAGTITPAYRQLLERVFGSKWRQGHELVRKWSDRMKGSTECEKT